MPRRVVHARVGMVAGLGAAYANSANQTPQTRLLEIVGGGLGGTLGSRLPDIIDPPTSGSHRSHGHAVVPAATLLRLYMEHAPQWVDDLRAMAKQFEAKTTDTDQIALSVVYALLAALLRIIAGAVSGLPAGHFSHLALDVWTPKGLPVI